MTDPIADMLSRIRNALMAKKKEVVLPHSKIKLGLANILVKEKYLGDAKVTTDKKPVIILRLKYDETTGEPAITSLRRVSKPGHRRYVKSSDIGKVLNGFGMAIISTPKGLMTDRDARRNKVGGEIVCEVY